jgi:hypothetical protein
MASSANVLGRIAESTVTALKKNALPASSAPFMR